MASKIRKGDEVAIIAGKAKGLSGTVTRVLPRKDRVIVEGQNIVKKHKRAAQNQEGGIIEMEAPIHISNVMLVDPTDNRPTRVGFEVRNEVKVRVSRRTGSVIPYPEGS